MKPQTHTHDNYQKIPLDGSRRHFVFGDIHGRFEPFLDLLEKIEYDPQTDNLYSVGDLIDRGPHSVEVIEFFKEPNCYVVRGNHEQMLVNFKDWDKVWYHNGGDATLISMEYHNKSIPWLTTICKGFPIVLDVGNDDEVGAFRLVHAELNMKTDESALHHILATTDTHDLGESDLLWGRNMIEYARLSTNIIQPADGYTTRNVFSGHTPAQQVMRLHNCWWIDTWMGKQLTCVNPITQQIFSVDL